MNLATTVPARATVEAAGRFGRAAAGVREALGDTGSAKSASFVPHPLTGADLRTFVLGTRLLNLNRTLSPLFCQSFAAGFRRTPRSGSAR